MCVAPAAALRKTVEQGLTEFACPICRPPQMLPLELMSGARKKKKTKKPLHFAGHDIDPTKIQVPCANCMVILNVPRGLARFTRPQCGADLAVDFSKVKQLFPPGLPPEDHVNEFWLLNYYH